MIEPRRPSNQDIIPGYKGFAATANGRLMMRILIILLIILALFGVVFFTSKAVSAISADNSVKHNEFQAVFLTNGQVYFGKLTHTSGDYVKLTDIFYLQVNNGGSQTSVQPSNSSSTANQQVSLAKLGNELHAPEDEMFISRSQVLFWENLKSSGKVVQAINNYQAKK